MKGRKPKKPKGDAMADVIEKNNLDLEIQKQKFILMGGSVKTIQKKLSQEDIKQIKKDYHRMYFALTSINWGQGMTLGMAWQKALSQMDAFVKSKTKVQNHPINDELTKIHTAFRRRMAKHIMTSEYSNNKLQEKYKKLFVQDGEKDFSKHKQSFDNIYKKYMPQQQIVKNTNSGQFDAAKIRTQQKLQMLLQMKMLNQHAA